MTELRRIIDEIRFLIQNDDFTVTDELKRFAAEYAAHCREANTRLRKCEEFLNQGLRSEALHFAEIAPNLLEVTSQLDFPERSAWEELLSGYALPLPEPLLVDVAGILNEAYALQEPLQRLLDQHRLYALARSPLPQRLDVLRSLAEQDAGSVHWESDIREMELARFREIESELPAAVNKGRSDQLKSFLSELSGSAWLETPPASLVKSLKQRVGHVVRSQARGQLESLEESLRMAHSTLDIALARQLRDAWNRHAKSAQLSSQEDVSVRVSPVLEWIEDEDRRDAAERTFRRAVAELEQSINDDGLSSIELQRYGDAVEKCGRGIPEALRFQYRNRLANLRLAETRRNRLKITSLVGGVVGILGIIAVAVYLANESQKAKAVIAAAESLISESQLDQATRLIEENSSRLPTEEALELKKKLGAAVEADKVRIAEFNSAIATVEKFDDMAASETAIQQARERARSVDEKLIVSKLEAEWKQRHQSQVAKDESSFRKQLASVTTHLQELDGLLNSPDAESKVQSVIDLLSGELATLRSLEPKVAKEFGSQATLLENRFHSVAKAHSLSRNKNALLNKLGSSMASMAKVTDVESRMAELRVLLNQFASDFPTDSRTAGFKDAADAEILKAYSAKAQLIAEWKQLWPQDASEVEIRLQATKAFLNDYPGSPDRGAMTRYEDFLKSLQRRETGDEDSDQPVRIRLRELFQGKLINAGHMLRVADGSCYYLPKATDYTMRRSVTLRYIAGFNDELKVSPEYSIEMLQTRKTETPPQKAIADHVFQTVTSVPMNEWDGYLQDIAQSLIKDRNVDAFLRYLLLLKTLQYAATGNSLLEKELKGTLAYLNDSQMDLSVSWMDPHDTAANASRELAKVLLMRVTDLDSPWTRAAVAQDKLGQEVLRRPFPIGWLARVRGRGWELQTQWTAAAKHGLICTSAPGEDGTRDWVPLGTIEGGKVDLNIPPNTTVSEGGVVFAAPLSLTSKTTATR